LPNDAGLPTLADIAAVEREFGSASAKPERSMLASQRA
jgi:hypothetical protein